MVRRRVLRIDSREARAFPAAARRARVLRVGLTAVAITLLAAAVASARDLDTRERGLLPQGTVGVVVLDLSLSISDEDYVAVRRALRRLADEDARIGLVVFSDIPYELLPPGTPSTELRPLLRLLAPRRLGPPVNPWVQSFRAGTRVSSALELARQMLERDGVEQPSILLVSDLETSPEDVPVLTRTVRDLQKSDIELHVAALNPTSDAIRIFGSLLDEDAFVLADDPASASRLSAVSLQGVPRALAVLGVLFLLALAAHERFAAELGLPRRRSQGAS